jgi:hypothetical protein
MSIVIDVVMCKLRSTGADVFTLDLVVDGVPGIRALIYNDVSPFRVRDMRCADDTRRSVRRGPI